MRRYHALLKTAILKRLIILSSTETHYYIKECRIIRIQTLPL